MPAVSFKIRFATDDDMLDRDASIERGPGEGAHPRTDRHGNPLRTWDRYHRLAMEEVERRLRTKRGTTQVFEIGKLSHRSREHLRPAATYLALHYLFKQLDDEGGGSDNVFARKAAEYWRLGQTILEAESTALDYDADGDGEFDATDQQRPMPYRIIRG